jgi:hypothetical protein
MHTAAASKQHGDGDRPSASRPLVLGLRAGMSFFRYCKFAI